MTLPVAAMQTVISWLQAQRWFGGKGRDISTVRQMAELPLRADASLAWQILAVDYGSSQERYLVTWPVGTWVNLANEKLAEIPAEWVTQPAGLQALWREFVSQKSFAWLSREFGEFTKQTPQCPARWVPFEQSNTCVIFAERFILKLFRKLATGINPDVEIGRALVEQKFDGTVPPLHAILAFEHAQEVITSGVVHQYLSGAKTAWEVLLELLQTALSANGESQATDSLAPALEMSAELGALTARMHTLLAQASGPDFEPEEWSAAERASLAAAQMSYSAQQIALLLERLSQLPAEAQPVAQRVIDRQEVLLARFAAWNSIKECGQRIRIHGDYHLGQVLVTASADDPNKHEFWAIDFEGEPARPLAERRRKRSPLQDVAGMIRSLHYAVSQTRLSHSANAAGSSWAIAAYPQLVAAFIAAYDSELKIDGLLPAPHTEDRRKMLELFVLEKALYELGYELLNRPDWIQVPLGGIAELLES